MDPITLALISAASAGVSGGFGIIGAQNSAAASRRTAIINAMTTERINAQNLAQQQLVNAQSAAQWNKSFRATRGDLALARRDARNLWNQQLAEGNKDRALQKEFAQHGVQWRSDDARAAGIHPLAALGAQLASSSPIQVGGSVATGSVPSGSNFGVTPAQAPPPMQADTSMGRALAGVGQDISRAMMATATQLQRDKSIESTLSLENQGLQNDLLRAQIARLRQPSIGPAFPSASGNVIPGQGNSPAVSTVLDKLVKNSPGEGTVMNPQYPGQEQGNNPALQYYDNPDGSKSVMPGKVVKERLEDTVLLEIPWAINNIVRPYFGYNLNPPYPAPEGKKWTSGWDGALRLIPKDSSATWETFKDWRRQRLGY